MRSTFSGLNALVRGLYAQQLSLDTVSHNISNASTEGYSRQRVNLSTTTPEVVYGGSGSLQVGTGVSIDSVTRARDSFVDLQYWSENSSLGYADSAHETLGKIEQIFNDDLVAGTGIQTVLNNFWNAWQTLSTSSSDSSAQTAVRESGAAVVTAISHAYGQLQNLVSDVNDTLSVKVDQINDYANQIFNLNRQISNVEINGQDNANDLRDRRDLLVDKLSSMANVRVFEDKDHNYSIQVSNVNLVNGYGTTPLAVQQSIDPVYGNKINEVIVKDSNPPMAVQFTNGEMYSLQQANTVSAQQYMDKLATISKFFLQEFNGVHRAGYGSDNSTGTNFFGDPSVDYKASPLADNGQWINALKINSQLYRADGLNLIAIKTAEVKSVVQSNSKGGTATVSGTYLPPDTKYHNFIVRITGTGAGGLVTGAEMSEDGGATFNPLAAGTNPGEFTLGTYGLTIKINSDTDNLTSDTYRFSVPQGNSIGDNATNLANAIKQPTQASSVLKGLSLDGYYGALVADLGIKTQSSKNLADNQQKLITQITNWREETAGVNVDEEMANMIRFQKGYGAAARVVTAMDEMLDKLINGTGSVGR